MIQPQDDKFWELIIKRIEEEKCILIIGPDIALTNSDKSINQQLKEYLENNATGCKYYSDDEFFSFADDAEKEYALMDIQRFYSQLQPNNIHERIAEIPFHLVISLSPDLVLKTYFEAQKLSFSYDFYNKEQNPKPIEKPTAQKPLIYNLFGSVDTEGSVILTYDDLFDYLISVFSKFELPQEFKSQLQASRLVLFLGFQFDKWYFKLLLRLLNLQEGKINHAGLKDRQLLPQIRNFYADEFKMKFLNYSGYEIIENIYEKFKSKNLLRIKSSLKTMEKPEIFVSYGWGGESETVVNKIYEQLVEKSYNIIRDKIDLGYKGNIKQFMQTIGKGKCVIVVISDKYLKSENCMYEMLEIKKNGDVYDRIFPVVLSDARIYDEIDRIDYLNYWDDKVYELQEKIKTIRNPVGTGQVIEKINQYNDIRRIIDEITDMLRNMNTLTPTMHNDTNFEALVKAMDTKIQTDSTN